MTQETVGTNAIYIMKERLALAHRIAFFEGLREESGNEHSGHISVRSNNNPDRFLILGHLHHDGEGLRNAETEDILTVDLEGRKIEGKHEVVEEIGIHTSIYKARPEIMSVFHMHPPAAVALGSTDQKIEMLSMRSTYFVEGVAILDTGPGVIDTEEIASEMVKKLGNLNALIHKGHGVVTVGRTLEEACLLGLYLEGSARNQILAKQFGGELKPFSNKLAFEYANSHSLAKRPFLWRYYENKWKDVDTKGHR